jgi:hypothetical protein
VVGALGRPGRGRSGSTSQPGRSRPGSFYGSQHPRPLPVVVGVSSLTRLGLRRQRFARSPRAALGIRAPTYGPV